MNNKPHFDRLNTILDILLKNNADKDQYFFGTAAEIRKRTDWAVDSFGSGIEFGTDGEVLKFVYGNFTFHFYELPEITPDHE